MRARVHIELRAATGEVIAFRDCRNAVMRGGARLIADLFAGRGTPITHMGVGTSDAPESESFATESLANEAVGDATPLAGGTEAAIPIEAFQAPEIDEIRRVVRLRLRATLPAGAAVGTVREAGLLARDNAGATLYNRVTFAPMAKGSDHELTLFWEVSFPYGDLQWLL
jgi:hypothetical protein